MNTTERSTGRPTHGRWDKNTILRWYFLLSPFCTFFFCSFSSLSLSFFSLLFPNLFCSFPPLTPFFYPLTLLEKSKEANSLFTHILFFRMYQHTFHTVQRISAPFPLLLILNSFLSSSHTPFRLLSVYIPCLVVS